RRAENEADRHAFLTSLQRFTAIRRDILQIFEHIGLGLGDGGGNLLKSRGFGENQREVAANRRKLGQRLKLGNKLCTFQQWSKVQFSSSRFGTQIQLVQDFWVDPAEMSDPLAAPFDSGGCALGV